MKSADDVACGLVALLGWDWWDGIEALEQEPDEVLHAYLDILRPSSPDEPENIRIRARIGTRAALRILHLRALDEGRWSDDGGRHD